MSSDSLGSRVSEYDADSLELFEVLQAHFKEYDWKPLRCVWGETAGEGSTHVAVSLVRNNVKLDCLNKGSCGENGLLGEDVQ